MFGRNEGSEYYYQNNLSAVQAHKWEKNGDHPDDYAKPIQRNVWKGQSIVGKKTISSEGQRSGNYEGQIVRRYNHPLIAAREVCACCGKPADAHGWIDSGGEGKVVCPGDWIIKNGDNVYLPVKPYFFDYMFVCHS